MAEKACFYKCMGKKDMQYWRSTKSTLPNNLIALVIEEIIAIKPIFDVFLM